MARHTTPKGKGNAGDPLEQATTPAKRAKVADGSGHGKGQAVAVVDVAAAAAPDVTGQGSAAEAGIPVTGKRADPKAKAKRTPRNGELAPTEPKSLGKASNSPKGDRDHREGEHSPEPLDAPQEGTQDAPKAKRWTDAEKRDHAAQEAEKAKHAGGRPALMTPELQEAILSRISDGKTLTEVCDDPAMPTRQTVTNCSRNDPEFFARLVRARIDWADAQGDVIVQIADDASSDWTERKFGGQVTKVPDREVVERSKLRIGVRQWLMERYKPKSYGPAVLAVQPDSGDAIAAIHADATVMAPDEALPANPVL